MSVTKEQALINLTKAKLKSVVTWTLYVDLGADYDDHLRAEAKYYTMRETYIECGVMTWDEALHIQEYTITAKA